MKFYKRDGTYKIQQDTDFGWWLADIVNLSTPETPNKRKCNFHDPAVKIFPIKSVQETLLSPEGFIATVDACPQKFQYENLNALKEKLTNMISANIGKNKLLLSVVNFSLFKKLTEKDENLIKSNEPLRTADKDDIRENSRTPEKLNCRQSEQLKVSKTTTHSEKFLECIAFLHQNLEVLDTKIKEMQEEVLLIKIYFEEENERSQKLLNEYRKFSKELKESNYINEILLLLMGKAEKINSNNWPFKICSNKKKEMNLII